MIVRVNNLVKSYGKTNAVNSVSFDINPSDFIAIIGPSGSGKTTLLSLLTGMLTPTSGEVFYDTKNLAKIPSSELARLRARSLGLIFQFSELISNLSVKENILLPALFTKKFSDKEYQVRCDYLMEKLELTSLAKQTPPKLSGGQIQKVSIARSLINDPEILLADEPSGDLDPENRSLVRELFNEYNQRGLTILLVTHDMRLAFDAKTIYEMRDGKFTKVIK